MIISGGSRCNGGFFAKHLTNEKENKRATLCEMRGVAADTVDGAFREMAGVASGTRAKNFFYHANLNPRADEFLTPEQWTKAIDLLEKNLGLTGQPRFVMEHEKDGRVHRHVIWSRIDTDRMRTISDSQTAKVHERTSRELEIMFGLARGQSVLEPNRDEPRSRNLPAWETFRGKKGGIDPRGIKDELSALWRASDGGQAFAAAMKDRGYVLARGDRRDFVVVDQAGDGHSLARRLDGVKAADVRLHMADIDRDRLPSVAEARVAQRQKFTRDGTFDRAAAVASWEYRIKQSERLPAPGITRQGSALSGARPEITARAEGPTNRRATREMRTDAEVMHGPKGVTPGRAGIAVMDGMARMAGQVADICAAILTLGAGAPASDRTSANPHREQAQARERARDAIDHMRESMERGEGVNVQDLRNLTPQHLRSLATHGDDGLRALIQRDEGGREPDRSYERER